MPVRITGLNSGLDTDSIVRELVKSYSGQKDNIKKQQTKLQWKQDAWKDLNTKIYSFYSSQLSNLRWASAYKVKSAKSSDESKATVKASTNAPAGTQKLEILETAQAGYLTGSKVALKGGGAASVKTGLYALGLKGDATLNVEVDGATKKVNVTENDTIQDVVQKFRDVGLNASFDTDSQRFFLSSKTTGSAGNFNITVDNYSSIAGVALKELNGADATGMTKLEDLGITEDFEVKVKVGDETTTVKIEKGDALYMVAGRFEAAGLKASFNDTTHKLILTKDSGEDVDFELTTSSTDAAVSLGKLGITSQATRHSSHGNDALEALGLLVSDNSASKTIVKGIEGAALMTSTGSATRSTALSELGINGAFSLKVKINGQEETIQFNKTVSGDDSDDKLYMLVGKLEAAGIKANFDEKTHRLVVASYGKNNPSVEFVAETDEEKEILNKLGLGDSATTFENPGNDKLQSMGLPTIKEYKGGAIKVEGQDAKILLNGAEFTSTDGNFSINGLTINALQKTDGAITINTQVDAQGIYDSVKKFFKEYNDLIKEMDTLFNADSAKGFEPLTDDEKEEMSEGEIEKWEKKIKDSLLRRDQTLSGVADVLKTALAKSYVVNGKTLSLSNFGISTQSYMSAGKNEKNMFHIDGDSDDALTKSNNDKLLKAITEDPDGAADFFSQLIKGAYESLDKKMRSTSVSSAYVVYNDKQITKDLKDYDDKMKKWEDKVKYYEDFYYKKFSGMEKALANLQSSQNSLSMLLGQ